ncbi:MAG: hypothetical protein JWL95_978 [Gemmatimonadetes bacterium]|nr:hypothetical protein [Gemmatimonadota bacterium]
MASPFRDGEEVRVEMLTQENAELQAELDESRSRIPENKDAFLRRLEQQRDEARAELARVAGPRWSGDSSRHAPARRVGPILDLSGRRIPLSEPESLEPRDRLARLERANARLRRELDAARAALEEDTYAAWLERDRDKALAERRALESERAEMLEKVRRDTQRPMPDSNPAEPSVTQTLVALVRAWLER